VHANSGRSAGAGLRVVGGLYLVAIVAFLACTPWAASAATCPNEAIRVAQGTTSLPACMAIEMVSPPKKFVLGASRPSFSVGSDRILFSSRAALADTPGLQYYKGDSYIATRNSSGWTISPTSPPASAEIAGGGERYGGPFAFNADLETWLQFGATQAQNMVGAMQFYRGDLGGAFQPISPLLVPIDDSGSERIIFYVANTQISGAAPDLSAAVFRLADQLPGSATFLPDDPTFPFIEGNIGRDRNQYLVTDVSGTPSIELLARDKSGKAWGGECGTRLGGGIGASGTRSGTSGGLKQGAISSDASRIYFTTRPDQPDETVCSTENPLRILERTQSETGPQIQELVPGSASESSDFYQGASADGSKVFFTTTRNLVAGDQDTPPSGAECSGELGASPGCDLYLYDRDLPSGERLIQVSAGGSGDPTPGKGADVLSSITSLSGDGTHVYFVAQGVLTTAANPEGATAAAGQPNLYMYERDAAHPSGRTTFIGTLSPEDEGKLWGVERSYFGGAYSVPVYGATSGEGGDGHILAFASKAPLTSDDADGGARDVFRYDATAEILERVSVSGPGGSDGGSLDANVNANDVNLPLANPAEEGRWVSEDGDTIAFLTEAPLAAGDEGTSSNAYVWRDGEVGMLPGETDSPPTVAALGNEVGYETDGPLLPQDGDTASDVYVARTDGGFPFPQELAPCDPTAGACQGPAAIAPAQQAPATNVFSGPGNVRQNHKKKKHRHRRHHHKKRSHKHGGQR
jgi:hypothetical protein